jgi:predicted transcriptional regulator
MANSLKLDDEMKGRLQRLAATRDRSAHWVMREAIRQYVEREEARESFKAEANASWAAYQDAGRHLTGDETAQWLNSWGTPAEIARPARHD